MLGAYIPVTAQTCYQYGPTVSLKGKVRSQSFPGPPNYESIHKGDRKETITILGLAEKLCTTGTDQDAIDVGESGIREVQLVVTTNTLWASLLPLIGKNALVVGTFFTRTQAITGRKFYCA